MCPKRSLGVILEKTELGKSKAYGFASAQARPDTTSVVVQIKDDFRVPGVIGYTGFKNAQAVTEKPFSRGSKFIYHPPPGYTGFVPIAKSESLFGKSYSVIAAACAKRVHAP